MGAVIKVIFVVVPLGLLIFGLFIIYQGAQFWFDMIVKTPDVQGYSLQWVLPAPVTAKVFFPQKIRPDKAPIELEVLVSNNTSKPLSLDANVQIISLCEFVRIKDSQAIIKFDDNSPIDQSFITQLEIRSVTAPTYCEIIAKVDIPGNFSGVTTQTIPIDFFTGYALALGQIILGAITTFLGIKGITSLEAEFIRKPKMTHHGTETDFELTTLQRLERLGYQPIVR